MRIQYPGFPRLLIVIFLLNILAAQLLHEAGHWAVLQAYGRQPLWSFTSLVQLWDRAPSNPVEWVETTASDGVTGWLHLGSPIASDLEWLLFLVAGPLIQLVAIVAGLLLARYGRSPTVRTLGFIVAMVNAFSGFLYQVINLLGGVGGDEALIGHYSGWSPLAISAALALAFGLSLAFGFWALETWKMRLTWAAALFLGILPVGPLLMRANTMVIEQVDAGNPLFRSLIGFSLPVFLTGLVCMILIALLAHWWKPQAVAP